jgi:hypothetical protein
MTTIKNRLTRSAVREHTEAAKALVLESQQVGAHVEAVAELKDLLGSHKIINRGPRVAHKVVWYVKKLEAIENRFVELHKRLIGEDGRPRFTSCEDAYQLLYQATYLYRNCEQLIAFHVYAEAVLLQIDRAIADTVPGVSAGDIIQPGLTAPPADLSPKQREELRDLDQAVEKLEFEARNKSLEAAFKGQKGDAAAKLKAAQEAMRERRGEIERGIGRQLIPVDPDGNCFFHAIQAAGAARDFRALRTLAADQIARDRDLLAIARAIRPDYVAVMRAPAASAADVERYGGYLEAVALSRALGRKIRIYAEGRGEPYEAWDGAPGGGDGSPAIEVFWHAYGHYSAISPNVVVVSSRVRDDEPPPVQPQGPPPAWSPLDGVGEDDAFA